MEASKSTQAEKEPSLFAKSFKKFSLGAIFVLSIAVAVQLYQGTRVTNDNELVAVRQENILKGLEAIERSFTLRSPPPSVFVGFGSCVDIFAKAIPLFKKIGFKEPQVEKEHGVLRSSSNLLEEFLFYFKKGAAAERYVSNRELFDKLVETAKQSDDVKIALGGNAPVIAQRIAKNGGNVVLGAQNAADLPIDGRVVPSGPFVESSDIHLILEYDKNEKFEESSATRANRFIVHSDRYNPVLAGLDSFKKALETKNSPPEGLVVGGLQMMEGYEYPDGKRDEHFAAIKELLSEVDEKTRVHFELASFVDDEILQNIKESVIPFSDSIGMNEQELPNLLSLMKTGKAISVSDAYPRIASVLDQMREIYKLTKAQNYPRLLSRLHVHNIAFQAIAVRKSAGWRKTMTATAISSLTAHRHVCQTEDIDLNYADVLMDESFSKSILGLADGRIHLNPEKPVSCWEETIAGDAFKICVAPVLVCRNVKQTAGGGDNISGAGLLVQL